MPVPACVIDPLPEIMPETVALVFEVVSELGVVDDIAVNRAQASTGADLKCSAGNGGPASVNVASREGQLAVALLDQLGVSVEGWPKSFPS